jgi:hypothetical protein
VGREGVSCLSITEFNVFDWVEFVDVRHYRFYVNCNPDDSKYYGKVIIGVYTNGVVDFHMIGDITKLQEHLQNWLNLVESPPDSGAAIQKYLNSEFPDKRETKYLQRYSRSLITPRYILENAHVLKSEVVSHETLLKECQRRADFSRKYCTQVEIDKIIEADMSISMKEHLVPGYLVERVRDALIGMQLYSDPLCISFGKYMGSILT